MIRHLGTLIFFILMLSSLSSGAPLLFTLGYIRTSAPDVDSVNTLAGFLSTVQYANTHNLVPGVRFQLNVTTIPCRNYSECSNRSPANNQLLQDFIAAMPGFSAILKPNYVLANTIVDEATRLGGIPVLDADDIRMTSYQNGSEHIINFNANWQRQIDHLFTYMHQTDRCVHTGIAHGTAATAEYPVHIARIHQLFAAANFPLPPSISSLTASDADFATFFQGDSRRHCFIFLGSNRLLVETVKRLQKINFDFKATTFYGVSTVVGDTWFVNGSADAFVNTKFIQWGPQFESPMLQEAYTELLLNIDDYAHLFGVGAPPTTMSSTYTFQAYLTMVYLFETIRDAVANEANPNTTGPLPLAWSKIVDSFYADARSIEGYRFNPLARSCPRAPMKQICFCNTLTRTSYMFGINTTTGLAYPIFDDVAKGQRSIASLEIENGCGYFASAWSYPITGLALYPSELMGNGHRNDQEEAYDIFQGTYGTMTYESNYAPTAPTRALRYAAYDIHANESLQAALDTYIETIRPFVIYGSMAGKIADSRGVLTLATSLVDIEMEDPPLVPHSQWRWDIVSMKPVVADYIHGLVGYYAQNSARFGSVHAIACTQRGAELISMSFATWGFDVPVSSIVVSDDPVVWAGLLKSWLGTGASPFVMAVTAGTNNSMTTVAVATAAAVGKGTMAISCSMRLIHTAQLTIPLNGSLEILFGTFRTAWWTPDITVGVPSALQAYASNPRYQIAMLGLGVAQQLYTQVYYDYTATAAQVLFRTSVISASGTAFGPFSNETCTEAQIEANARDRSCQCAKGIRTIFVHSMRDYQDGVASARTNDYTYTMSTCGIEYRPYVAPFVPSAHTLSSGAIAGIAVGCSLALLLVVAAFVANSLLFGRNNRAAPKDPTKPFAIVFTDIQSSTSLWARAPAAMSEAVDHHHQIMRKALRKNSGYEVKTVGDSFMVAFKDAADASRFALDAQEMLHAADWSAELDATYVELIAEGDEEDEQSIQVVPNGHEFNSHLMALRVTDASQNCDRSTNSEMLSSQYSRRPRPSEVKSAFGDPSSLPRKSNANPSAIISHSAAGQPDTASSICENQQTLGGVWHGLRVRIGIHYGMGDIRKDPVSLGYDYYGTVVNTAARVEGVGHGGQTLLTDAAFEALPPGFAKSSKAVIITLGPQPLRGLDAPIKLYQLVPNSLQGRRFPALRLHIEKETEDTESDVTETATATATNATEPPEAVISRLCETKQFANLPPEEIMDRYHYFVSTFAPTPEKYRATVITKLAESWGFEKASKSMRAGEVGRTRLLVSLIAKVTKTHHAGRKRRQTRSYTNVASISQNMEDLSAHGRSTHHTEIASVSEGR